MPETHVLLLFLGSATILALMPGPGLFYLTGRTLAHGRSDGLHSLVGSAFGGLLHVVAAAIGLSALLMASATAFAILKVAGALYLLYLAVQTWRSASTVAKTAAAAPDRITGRAVRQGFLVEASNPKTAAFFLAIIPQFIDPAAGTVAAQFIVLGTIAVAANSLSGLGAILGTFWLRTRVDADGRLVTRLRKASAMMLGGIGVPLLFTRRPA